MEAVATFTLSHFTRKEKGPVTHSIGGYGVSKHWFGLEVRHPRCVGSITKNFVYYTYSQTQAETPTQLNGALL